MDLTGQGNAAFSDLGRVARRKRGQIGVQSTRLHAKCESSHKSQKASSIRSLHCGQRECTHGDDALVALLVELAAEQHVVCTNTTPHVGQQGQADSERQAQAFVPRTDMFWIQAVWATYAISRPARTSPDVRRISPCRENKQHSDSCKRTPQVLGRERASTSRAAMTLDLPEPTLPTCDASRRNQSAQLPIQHRNAKGVHTTAVSEPRFTARLMFLRIGVWSH